VPQKPDGNRPSDRITFTRGAAERIAEVVRDVELGNRDQQPLRYEKVPCGAPPAKVFRIATFTGAWSINAAKTVTFKFQTTTPNTVVATNLFCGLNPGTVVTDISISKEGTAWFLVQPNLTQQPGYSESGTQVLTIQNGAIRWIGTTAC
jgi:hypothetical protein